MKKGFTLIELLAVIIILSLLMIIAVPNVLGTLNDSKRRTFVVQVQSMYNAAAQQFTINELLNKRVTCFNSSQEGHKIEASNNSLVYKIDVDREGSITSLYLYDPTTGFSYQNSSVVSAEDITENKGTLKSGVTSYDSNYFTLCETSSGE